MNKLSTISTIALISALALSSCKKKWTCQCTINYNGLTASQSVTDTEKRTKKDAKEWCEKNNSGSYSYLGFTATYECELQ